MDRNAQEMIFDKQWKEYLELEKLIHEYAVKAEYDETGKLKGIIFDLCPIAKQMNYTLAIQAADLWQGATKETMESVCRVKRDDLDKIANKMNSSMRK